jgi:lipid-A-disaccharide synthase
MSVAGLPGAPEQPLRVGLVAGEASGDTLGAALIEALRARVPDLECFGVAGPKMVAAGCEAWAAAAELSVMGLAEVLGHLPRLLRLRAGLAQRFARARPDVFVGIDSPEFNLPLARGLKRTGIRCVQYVSPQVWAWRQGRVRTIGRDCDLVLCLLPFETEFYARHAVPAVFVGHPLADEIPLSVDRAGARAALGVAGGATLIALLPGSRVAEVARLGAPFAAAAGWIAARRPGFEFISPMASAAIRECFERQLAQVAAAPAIRVVEGQAQRVLAACDAAIVASGTATLETLLSSRPMVVAYKVNAITAMLLKLLVKVPYVSQPNLLVGRALVPELLQRQVTAEALGAALLGELESPAHRAELTREFERVHRSLRCGGAALAADAVLKSSGRAAPAADAARAGPYEA